MSEHVFEVTIWPAGLLGSFMLPMTVLVWAKGETVLDTAIEYLRREKAARRVNRFFRLGEMQALGVDASTIAALPVEELAAIVNLPFSTLQARWQIQEVPAEQRQKRPIYIRL